MATPQYSFRKVNPNNLTNDWSTWDNARWIVAENFKTSSSATKAAYQKNDGRSLYEYNVLLNGFIEELFVEVKKSEGHFFVAEERTPGSKKNVVALSFGSLYGKPLSMSRFIQKMKYTSSTFRETVKGFITLLEKYSLDQEINFKANVYLQVIHAHEPGCAPELVKQFSDYVLKSITELDFLGQIMITSSAVAERYLSRLEPVTVTPVVDTFVEETTQIKTVVRLHRLVHSREAIAQFEEAEDTIQLAPLINSAREQTLDDNDAAKKLFKLLDTLEGLHAVEERVSKKEKLGILIQNLKTIVSETMDWKENVYSNACTRAVIVNDVETLSRLLDFNPEIRKVGVGYNPGTVLHAALERKSWDCFKLLLDRFPDLAIIPSMYQCSPLSYAQNLWRKYPSKNYYPYIEILSDLEEKAKVAK